MGVSVTVCLSLSLVCPYVSRSTSVCLCVFVFTSVCDVCTTMQLVEYSLPDHPCPPLATIFRVCTSVKSWLTADPRNVAVVHCLVRPRVALSSIEHSSCDTHARADCA
jgi:hypothetical protein